MYCIACKEKSQWQYREEEIFSFHASYCIFFLLYLSTKMSYISLNGVFLYMYK